MDVEDADPRPSKRIRLDTEPQPNEQLAKELKCGIAGFVDPQTIPFSGTLKKRYTDFVVNEIQPNGTVLHLTELSPPRSTAAVQTEEKKDAVVPEKPEPQPDQSTSEDHTRPDLQPLLKEWPLLTWLRSPGAVDDAQSQTLAGLLGDNARENIGQLCAMFGDAVADQITKMYVQHLAKEAPTPVVTSPMTDRIQRTQAHQLIRQTFSSHLDSVTRDDGSITISPMRKSRGNGPQRQGNQGYNGRRGGDQQKPQGEYLHFTLYKENKDTAEAKGFLCRQLRIDNKRFEFAGTKDRRAVTTQRCSIYRMNINQLHAVGKRLRGTVIGNYEYQNSGLQLGQTGGNAFAITLRDVHTPNDEVLTTGERQEQLSQAVTKAAQSLSNGGFLNYFGLQRFGTFAVPTSDIGMRALQGDLQGAIDGILAFNPALVQEDDKADNTQLAATQTNVSEDDRMRAKGIALWRETGSSKEALQMIPRRFIAESLIIGHLASKADRRNDYLGAMMTVPRQTRTLYLHSYQSLVWNKMTTLRWQRYGNQVVEGDVILDNKDKQEDLQMVDNVDESGELVINPSGEDAAAPTPRYKRARHVTAEEAKSGKFSIDEVVLPLPGHDVLYPSHEIAQAYKDFMGSEEGGNLDPLNMKRSWKDASLTGEYRNLIARPSDLEVEVKRYKNDEEQLVSTDMDELKKGEGKENGQQVIIDNDEATEPSTAEAAKLAVVVKFKLQAGTFATMALRELLGAGNCKEHKPDFHGRR